VPHTADAPHPRHGTWPAGRVVVRKLVSRWSLAGVPVVALHIASQGRYSPIPHLLAHAAGLIEKRVVTPLIPFVRSDAE